MFVVNPFGGLKTAPAIYRDQVAPVLKRTHIDADMQETQYGGHATDIGKTLDLAKYDAVVTISGDGLLHELINGLMSHKDWQRAIKIPVGIIPGGTGNAMAQSLALYTINHAVLNIVKFSVRPLDLFSVKQDGQPMRYGHLAIFWGFMADCDIGSEVFRWAGQARVTVSALFHTVFPKTYRGRLTYLPWHPDTDPVPQPSKPAVDGTMPDLPLSKELDDGFVSEGWKTYEGEIMSLYICNTPWQDQQTHLSPFS